MKTYILFNARRHLCISLSLLFLFASSACMSDRKEPSDENLTPSPAITEQAAVSDIPDAYDVALVHPVLSFTDIDCLAQVIGQYEKYSMAAIGDVSYYVNREEYAEEERTEIIYYLDNVMSMLVDECGFLLPESLNIYVGSRVITQGYDGNICLNSGDLGRIEGLIAMMTGLAGELANYGLCYGLGIHVADEIKDRGLINPESDVIPVGSWLAGLRSDVTEGELAEFFSVEENLILMDLTVPVFEAEYFSPDDNLYAASAAYLFTRYMIEKYSIGILMSLIQESADITLGFDISYTEKCNEWLQEIGASCKRDTPEAAIRCCRDYGYTYALYRYVFHTKDMRSYIPVGFVDYLTDDVLTYPKIIFLLTAGEKDIDAVKEYLSPYFETDLEQIPCYYESRRGSSIYRNKRITYFDAYASFVHEYVHYITLDGYNNPYWLSEGIAEFASHYISCEVLMRYFQLNMENWKDIHASSGRKSFHELFLEIYGSEEQDKLIGILNDLDSYYTFYDRSLVPAVSFDELHPYKKTEGGFMSYQESGSLVNYLINTYGADTFFSLYKGEITLDEAYGKDINELYAELTVFLMHAGYEDALIYIEGAANE